MKISANFIDQLTKREEWLADELPELEKGLHLLKLRVSNVESEIAACRAERNSIRLFILEAKQHENND